MAFLTSSVCAVGNLTRDPEIRFTPTGKAVASFGLAMNDRRKVGEKWEDDTSFIDVVVWEDLAENCTETLEKGMRVMVYGRIKQNQWETDDGDKRSKHELIAECVGPELRWATAQVQRNERQGGYQTPADREASRAEQGAPPPYQGGDPGPQGPPPGSFDYDEEPF